VIFRVLTLFPEIFQGYLEASILCRAIQQGLISVSLINIRDFAKDRHRTCDDYTYGGGAGMVLKPQPLADALDSLKASAAGCGRVIYLTPSGRLFNQRYAEQLAGEPDLALICGRYEGIDQRIIDAYVSDEVSVGDYILAGGEVAALVVMDAVSRLVKGVIKEDSLKEESFGRGLLEYPQYTRPADFKGRKVPEVLLSGHQAEISRWRLRKSLEKTLRHRPELLSRENLPADIEKMIEEIKSRGEEDGYDQGD